MPVSQQRCGLFLTLLGRGQRPASGTQFKTHFSGPSSAAALPWTCPWPQRLEWRVSIKERLSGFAFLHPFEVRLGPAPHQGVTGLDGTQRRRAMKSVTSPGSMSPNHLVVSEALAPFLGPIPVPSRFEMGRAHQAGVFCSPQDCPHFEFLGITALGI